MSTVVQFAPPSGAVQTGNHAAVSGLTLRGALPVAVKLLAGQLGIDVRFTGNQPYWDGKVLNMSQLPFESPTAATLALGFMVHEVGHVRYTEKIGYPTKLHSCIGNALEDPRVEKCMITRFAGARRTLADLVGLMVKLGRFAPPQPDMSLPELAGFYALFRLRLAMLDQTAVTDLVREYRLQLQSSIPTLFDRLDAMIMEAVDCRSKADVLALTERIIELLKDSLDADKKKKDPKDLTSTDFSDLAAPEFAAIADDAAAQGIPQMPDSMPSTEIAPASDMVSSAKAGTNALRVILEDQLQALKLRRWQSTHRGPRVDARNLWRLQTGDMKVFEARSEGIGINTAVLNLLDRSLSMKHNLDLVMQVGFAIHSSLENIDGVRVCTAAFPAAHSGEKGVSVLTDFHDSTRRTAERYAGLKTFGKTPLSEALLWAMHALLAQDCTRRILVVETDGQPDEKPTCERLLKELEVAGIEVYGIGINIDVSGLISNSKMVTTVEGLAPAVFGMLRSAVLPKAA